MCEMGRSLACRPKTPFRPGKYVLVDFFRSNCYRLQTKFAKVMFLHVSVSHSVHRGGQGVSALEGAWSWGVSGPGGGYLVLVVPDPGGGPGGDPPGQLLLRVVRILLECILVQLLIQTIAAPVNV